MDVRVNFQREKWKLGDRFEVGEMLGSGGFVDVYAVHTDDGRDNLVGLRLKTEGFRNDAERGTAIERFKRQYATVRKLGPEPAGVFPRAESFLFDKTYWIIRERFDSDLYGWRKGPPLGWEEAACILTPPLRALQMLHDVNCFHRDVKPANMFFKGSRIVLGDFGFVTGVDLHPDLTHNGIIVGTPHYLYRPALQSRGSKDKALLSVRDAYALLVSWFELATGEFPIPSLDMYSLVSCLQSGEFEQALIRRSPKKISVFISAFLSSPRDARRRPCAEIAGFLKREVKQVWKHIASAAHIAAIETGD